MWLRASFIRSIKQYKILKFTPIVFRKNHYKNTQGEYKSHNKTVSLVLFSSFLFGSLLKDSKDDQKDKDGKERNMSFEPGQRQPDLPNYSAEEVQKHNNKSSFWVTYKHGVYDVTKFLPSHPGGEQIYNAAGLSIEPFWNVYGMHKTKEIFMLLETYRIGNLNEDDVVDHTDEELWVKEPIRDSRLIVKTQKPFNAEIPPKLQIENFDTPDKLFYVRQHMPVPEIDPANHKLRVIIKDGTPRVVEFSLQDLEDKFPRKTFRAALMCAGNRRSEMNKVKPVKGINWAGGAISNGVWSGVLLRDVLLHCGVDLENTDGKHVILTGADIDATGENFSTSVPLWMVSSAGSRVLLATAMNGEALSPDRGRPLRALVPGAPAVRSVKWLQSITISEDESSSHWHQKDYRAFNPSKTWETANFALAPPVYSLPVTSLICDPGDGETVLAKNGYILVRGYAYSGGGAKILRVDVSSDRGDAWTEATITAADDAPPGKHYSWTFWSANMAVSSDENEVELWVKATDSNFNTQPENFNDIWNIRGILSNAYHKIKVRIQH